MAQQRLFEDPVETLTRNEDRLRRQEQARREDAQKAKTARAVRGRRSI